MTKALVGTVAYAPTVDGVGRWAGGSKVRKVHSLRESGDKLLAPVHLGLRTDVLDTLFTLA